MNKRLWSGVMAGVMAVTSSAVLEIQSFAEESSVTLKTATLGSWESCGDVLLASAGVLTEDSIIRVTSTAGTNLKEENDDGEEVTPEYAFGIVCDNEWDKESENYIRVAYNSETGVATYDIPYSKLKDLSRINVQSNLHSESTITIEAIGFAEDTRAVSTLADVTTPIGLDVWSDSSWLIGKMANGNAADEALTSAWKGKTVGELRAAVKELKVGEVGYYSDTAGAGSDVFGRGVYVDCGDGGFFQSNGTPLDTECLALTDDMFQKDANDDCVIQEIGTFVGSLAGWDGDAGKSVSLSAKIDALADGSTIIYEPVQDSRAVLNLAAPSGRIKMWSYVDDSEGSWINGGWAWGSYYYSSIDGVTYGTTTFGQFLEKYKYASVADIPFYGSSLSSLKADELGYQIAIDFTDDTDINFNGVDSLNGAFHFFEADDTDLSTLSDKVIRAIQIKINPCTYWDDSLNQSKSVNAEIAALEADESFTIDFTEPSGSVLVEGTRDGWGMWGGIKIASAGILNENSTIVFTAKLPADYTEENDETGEIEAPADIFGIFIDNDFGDGYIYVPYNSETGESSYTLTYDQLVGKNEIGIQNRTTSEIEFKIEAFNFDEDTRSEVTASKITDLIGIEIEEQQSWIVGNHGGNFIKDEALSSAWSGKTVKELRETVGKINIPAMDFFSDSVNAGSDAFTKGIIIRLNDVDWETGGSRTMFTSSGVDYIDSLFTDDSHDDCTISEIGMWVETAYEWTDLGNTCTNDAINALKAGDTIIIEPVEDTREVLTLSEPSGAVEMNAFTEDSDWYEGINASGNYFYTGAPEGITLGTTTLKQLKDNYKTISVPEVPFFSSSLTGVTGSDFQYTLNIDLEDSDGNYMNVWGDTNSFNAKTFSVDSVVTSNDSITNLEDYVITGFNLNIRPKSNYNEETGKNYTASSVIKSLNDGDSFIVEFTEDTREEITLPAISGTGTVYAWTDDSWLDGAGIWGVVNNYAAPDGIIYGTTTLKDVKDNFKSIKTPAVPFFSASLEGVTADDLGYNIGFIVEDAEGNEKEVEINFDSLSAQTVRVDNLVASNDDIGSDDLDDYVITGMRLGVNALFGNDSETNRSYTICEAIKNLNNGDSFTIQFTEDTREEITLPDATGSVEMIVYENSDWLETVHAFGDVEFESAPEGITYGETTLKDLKDGYKSFKVSEIPFFSSDLNGITGSDFCYDVCVSVEEIDGENAYDISGGNDSLSATTISVDDMINFTEISDPENYVITKVYIRISAKTEHNSETDKNGVTSEAIKALSAGDTFIIELTEDTRDVLTIPSVSGEVEIGLWTSDAGLEAGGAFSLENVSGITYGTTTLKQLKESFKKISVSGVPFYGSDLDGIKASDLRYSLAVEFGNGDNGISAWGESENLSAQNFQVDNLLAEMLEDSDIANAEEYVVDNISLFIRVKTDDDGVFVSEAVRDLSEDDSFTVYFTEPKSNAPENIKATAGEEQVTLTWDAVDDAVGYLIKSADGKTQYTKTIKTTTYTVTGLTGGTEYSFIIYAYVDGKWYASEAVSATPTVGAYPKNVKAESLNRAVKLSWDAVDGATGYLIKSADGKTQYTKTIKTTSYTVSDLKNGTQYQFKVYAYVNGKWRGSAKVSKTPVAKPQNVVATAASHQITLTWDAVDNVTGYIIKSSDGTTQYTPKSIKTNSYTVTGLKNGTQYKFKVYAYSDGKWFASSTASKTPTGAPQNVKATAGSKSVTLSWDAVDGATGYLIKSADGTVQYTKTIKTTSYTIKNLTAGTQYKFKVYAYVDGKWYASGAKSKTPKA